MTANKDLKRLVRARARKTGESYAAALRHFQKEAVEERHVADTAQPVDRAQRPVDRAQPTLRRVERPELGFALLIPGDWVEGQVDPFTSSDLVVQFRRPPTPADAPAGTEICQVYKRDFSVATRLAFRAGGLLRSGLPVMAAASLHRLWLVRSGFTNVRVRAATVAGKSGARIDYERAYPDRGLWSGRDYFVVVGDHGFSLSLGTWARERDQALFDALAAGFELIEPAGSASRESGSGGADRVGVSPVGPEGRRPVRIDRKTRRRFAGYWPRARWVLLAAHEEAAKRGHPAIDPEHLLLGIAIVSGSSARSTLNDLGVSPDRLRTAVEAALPPGATAASPGLAARRRERLRFTARSEAILALAEQEAPALNRAHVGVGELLLAMLQEGRGPAYDVLEALGVGLEAYRAALQRHYESYPEGDGSPAAART